MLKIPSRARVVESLPERGLELAAVLPIHYPRALLRAFGYQPMEIWGPAGVEPIEGNVHFQSYTCGIVRNATSFLLQGHADPARLVLVPHTCDALQGMASVLKDFVYTGADPDPSDHGSEHPDGVAGTSQRSVDKNSAASADSSDRRCEHPDGIARKSQRSVNKKVITLYLPRDERPADLEFLVAELRHVGTQLAALSGRSPSDDALLAAIVQDEEADEALADLALRRALVDLDDAAFFALVRAREYLPSEDFVRLARSAPRLEKPRQAGVPLMISGIVPEPMEFFEHLREMGATVVADDLACVSRRLYPHGSSSDPWRRMAERLMWVGPDPTRGSPIRKRAQFLAHRLDETGARGLLVYDVKFCEPELFDLPLLRQTLEARKVPMLHVEFDLARTISQQTLTRLEAFVEMLR